LILVAFVLDEFYKKWGINTVKYNLVNLLGSGLLIYYAYTLTSYPFLILNAVWFLVAGYKLVLVRDK
jgi:hypothetical protein